MAQVLTKRKADRDYAVTQHKINNVLGPLANKFEISDSVIHNISRMIEDGIFFDAKTVLKMIAAQNRNDSVEHESETTEEFDVTAEAVDYNPGWEYVPDEIDQSGVAGELDGDTLYYTNHYEKNVVFANVVYMPVREQQERLLDEARKLIAAGNFADNRNRALNVSANYVGIRPMKLEAHNLN